MSKAIQFWPCISDPITGKISNRVGALMSRENAENFLKRNYSFLWRNLEAIPQPENHPYFRKLDKVKS